MPERLWNGRCPSLYAIPLAPKEAMEAFGGSFASISSANSRYRSVTDAPKLNWHIDMNAMQAKNIRQVARGMKAPGKTLVCFIVNVVKPSAKNIINRGKAQARYRSKFVPCQPLCATVNMPPTTPNKSMYKVCVCL